MTGRRAGTIAALALAAATSAIVPAPADAAWSAPFDVAPLHSPVFVGITMEPLRPELQVAAADGVTAFAWTDSDATTTRLRARTRRAVSGALGPIIDIARGDLRLGGITVDVASAGDILFTWAIREERVQARRLIDGRLGPIVELARGQVGGGRVALDERGDAVVAWTHTDNTDKRVQLRSLAPTGALGRVVTVPTPGLHAGYASVAVAPGGRAAVAWDNGVRGARRLFARTATAGGQIGPVRTLWKARRRFDRALYPDIALAASGDATFAWKFSPNIPDKTLDRTQMRFLSASGRLGPIITFPRRGHDPGYDVAVAPGGNGAIAWRQGGKRLVRASLLTPGGRLRPANEISNVEAFPRLAVDRGGDATFAWGTDAGVFARVLGGDGALGPVAGLAAPGEVADGPYSEHAVEIATGAGTTVAWQRKDGAAIRAAMGP